jgi:hypothetical protein
MDRKSNARIKSLALVLASMIGAPAAQAWEAFGHCDGYPQAQESARTTYQPSSGSFPSGSVQRTALERVRTGWNTAPGNWYRISFSYSSATSWRSGDGVNSVGFTSAYSWGSSTLAVTIRRYEPCIFPYFDGTSGEIEETDILFNPARTWNYSTAPAPSSTGTSMALVGLHEFGHSLGLAHENDVLATMNAYYPNGGALGNGRPDPHADDLAGAFQLYPAQGGAHDLATSAYRRTGSGTSAPISMPAAVARGSSVAFPYTVSNRGTYAETVMVHFFASTDSLISTTDPYLGSRIVKLDPREERTITSYLTIPTALATGSHYFGYLIDPTGSIPETDESNNRTRYATRVSVQ